MVQEEIGPVAGVSLVVVGQTGLALVQVRISVGAFDVVGTAVGCFGVDAVAELAAWRADRDN